MKNLDYNHLIRELKNSKAPLVIFGTKKIGALTYHALNNAGVKVDYFCDDSEQSLSKKNIFNTPIISSNKLKELDPGLNIFIGAWVVYQILPQLKKMNFKNIHNSVNLFKNTDFSKLDTNMSAHEIKRRMDIYKAECDAVEVTDTSLFNLKYVDITVTEACSMKCESCSNLMQYYLTPRNSDLDLLFKSIDRLMKTVDSLYEFRVVGGEPFVNKQIGKVINKLLTYKTIKEIVIYTNATIIPKGENFECLKNDKIFVEITDYGSLSKRRAELISLLEANNIRFTSTVPLWTDSGTLKYQNATEEQLKDKFKNCCMNDKPTILNGKLYKCPFSANAHNLNAIPLNKTDVVDLGDDNKTIDQFKKEILKLHQNNNYLEACKYCNGRDHLAPKIIAAIQTKKPLPIPKY
jgi:organic radical activating enzyme